MAYSLVDSVGVMEFLQSERRLEGTGTTRRLAWNVFRTSRGFLSRRDLQRIACHASLFLWLGFTLYRRSKLSFWLPTSSRSSSCETHTEIQMQSRTRPADRKASGHTAGARWNFQGILGRRTVLRQAADPQTKLSLHALSLTSTHDWAGGTPEIGLLAEALPHQAAQGDFSCQFCSNQHRRTSHGTQRAEACFQAAGPTPHFWLPRHALVVPSKRENTEALVPRLHGLETILVAALHAFYPSEPDEGVVRWRVQYIAQLGAWRGRCWSLSLT